MFQRVGQESVRMMSMLKQASARRAEKALKEILDKADDDSNGRVRLKDFMDILEANDVKVKQLATLTKWIR